MPTEVAGTSYLSISEVLRELAITRQTLWRWRQTQAVPPGRLYRGRRVLFAPDEVSSIREYAHRLEPIEVGVASNASTKSTRRQAKRRRKTKA